jgi:bacillithiol biosynthesis deacetylase BshB1
MVDLLAIAAHPDDVELSVAGTLLRSADQGKSFAICDLTEGERGTRGSMELRREETRWANRALGIDEDRRLNLGITDGNIEISNENVLKVVRAIRHFRPSILLLPWGSDRHPDHESANQLIRRAYFDSGLTNVVTEWHGAEQTPHRPTRLYCYFQTYEAEPSVIVDISDQFERKLDAVAAYSSQFRVPGRSAPYEGEEPETFISREEFIEGQIARMRHWGFLIGVRYGEALTTVNGPIKLSNIFDTV